MTGLDTFLTGLRERGVRLWVEGDRLKLRAPEGALNPELTRAISRRKSEILALLQPGPTPAIVPVPVQDSYELSAAQRRLWVLAQFPGAAAAYNIPLHQLLEGALDRTALETALARLVQRHDSLRTTFIAVAGEPRQVVHADLPVPLEYRDLSGAANADETTRQLGRDEARRPFDLTNGPLLRTTLLRLADDRHLLLFTIAHIIADGISLSVLARDLSRLYQAARTGRPDGLPRLAFGYPAYAAWQNRSLASGSMAAHRAYWLRRLAGELPVLALPTDHPRPPLQGFDGRELSVTLPPTCLAALEAFGRQRNASLFMVLHAALKVLLHVYTGQDSIVVGCAVAAREQADLADQVGFYLNMLALRSQIRGDEPFEAFFAQIVRETKDDFDHRAYPFDRLVDELNLPRDPSRSPLFDVMLILQNQDEPGLDLDGLRVRPAFEHPETSKFDLTFNFKATAAGLILGIEYDTGLFGPESVQAMADAFAALVDGFLADPRRPVRDLPMMTRRQQAALLARGRGPDLDLPACDLFDLIEAQARRTPDRCAVADGTAEWTYREVIRAAETHAARLQRIGVRPGDAVGVMLGRSADLPALLLGVLRAGACYVPLDPGFPADRLAYQAADAGIGALLTHSSLSALWPANVPICRVDEAASHTLSPRPVDRDASSCAYILYTSGSTGTPKGVRISHRSVVNLLLAMQRELGIGPDARLLAVTTISFDIAVLELFLPLIVGARVLVCDRETAGDGHGLARRLADTGADWMQATPTTWRMLLDAGWPGKPDLNVLSGGEPLPPALAEALLPITARLWNVYGPTETTVWSTCGLVEPGAAGGAAPIALGRPIANTCLYILDDRQRMLPRGATGELCIGGEGVALDYWRRPDLTAERFLPSLAVDPQGGRVYRTGDAARWNAGGQLDYQGRFDRQIKLRGHRIEPGEVEAVLTQHPQVRQAVVGLSADLGAGLGADRDLVAWYITAEDVPATQLRAHLYGRLPAYMIPAAFVPVAEFPLTPNGKVDRNALARHDRGADREVSHEPPRTEWEQKLALLWQEVLRAPRVGRHSNFFELGGHSLKAAAFIAALLGEFGVRLNLVDVFRQPTLTALARLAEERSAGGTAPPAPAADIDGIRPATAEELEMLRDL